MIRLGASSWRAFSKSNSFMMKKNLYILAAAFILASCGSRPYYSGLHGEKTQKDAEAEFVSSIKSVDSLTVLAQGEKCMQLLKENKLDDALSMLNILHENTVMPLPEAYADHLRQRFSIMPVYDFTFDYFAFSTEGNNDLAYKIEFAPKNADGIAPTMKFTFNPVKVDGKWYLTLKDPGMSSKSMSPESRLHDMAPAPEKIKLGSK